MSASQYMPDHLDRATSIARLHDFGHHWSAQVDHWRKTKETGTEKKYAQSFWSDLLNCFGIVAARQRLFEREAQRATTGGHGWIDFFMPGIAIGEAKSVDVNLAAAAAQVDDYLAGGTITNTEFPRYAVLTNFSTFRISKLDDSVAAEPIEFAIENIANHYDDLLFLIGMDTLTRNEEEIASTNAAKLMADLYVAVLGDADADAGVGEEQPLTPEEEDEREAQTSILMTRLLFLLYGDDAGLWERDLFYRWVEQETTAASLGAQLAQLFTVLNTKESRRSSNIGDLMARFPYVNGSIFSDSLPAEFFTPDTRDALLKACRFQWTSISVSVFGAMFQLVKSKEARRRAGEHYTSEENILKTIGPLFLDYYEAEADRLIRNKSTQLKDIEALLDDIASNVYCDPACGSGNFLNLAYAKLREIETRLISEKRRRFVSTGGESVMTLLIETEQRLSIDQFYGFEIGWWPAKIAETSMFLVDHQANLKLAKAVGLAPDRLPITISAHIFHGNALQFEWKDKLPLAKGKTFIFGNPPFIGQYSKTKQQTADMKKVWGKEYDGYLDYVTAWHAQAMNLFADQRPGEFAYVTTNSISQGQPVPALFSPLFNRGWRIKFAHRTFAWDSGAPGKAAVHCVIIGFTKDTSAIQHLWDYRTVNGSAIEHPVKQEINPYLIDGPNVIIKKRMKPLSPVISPATRGSQPTDGGHLIVEKSEYAKVAADPIAAKYLRPFRMGRELVRGLDRWCLWMAEDFNPTDIAKSSILKERIKAVRESRLHSSKKATQLAAETPHLFQEIRQPHKPYIAIPAVVSESRRFYTVSRLSEDVIAGNKIYVANDDSGLLFSLISSSMFITWQRAVGGRLKSDLNFANTLTWNTFPAPLLSKSQRDTIIAAGEEVLSARQLHPERSLADHYNPLAMAPELLAAHKQLDRVVDRAFGASKLITSEKVRLELLFANYQTLIEAETSSEAL